MQLNDKMLTLATGLFLAVGGGAASLWLGDHGSEPEIVVASVDVPDISVPTVTTIKPVVVDAAVEVAQAKAPVLPGADATATEQPEIIFAAVEPRATQTVGTDLTTVAVAVVAPELSVLAQIDDIVLTRSVQTISAPDAPRTAAVQPVSGSGMKMITLPAVPQADCTLDVRATRLPGARVRLAINAPCHPDVVATIEHAGLRFKELLDGKGKLSLKVPVFEEYARFDIQLSDGTETTVGAYIADLSSVERVGISFAGADDTFLHATQAGAAWDSDGHVWRLSPRSHMQSRATGGGYMTTLGDPTLGDAELAQVYSLPRVANAGALVEFSIESLRDDCGKSLNLHVARSTKGGAFSSRHIDTSAMACDGVDSLQLKNAVKAITLAQR